MRAEGLVLQIDFLGVRAAFFDVEAAGEVSGVNFHALNVEIFHALVAIVDSYGFNCFGSDGSCRAVKYIEIRALKRYGYLGVGVDSLIDGEAAEVSLIFKGGSEIDR